MAKPQTSPDRTVLPALTVLVSMLSLTEITARSVWQYGYGGMAAPVGALLALVLISRQVLPSMQLNQAHSLAHWLAMRSFMAARRPLALLSLGIDITLLSLLVQTLTMLVSAHLPGDITFPLAGAMLCLAIIYALPQPQADRYRLNAGAGMLFTALLLSALAVALGFDTPIAWDTVAARSSPVPDAVWMGLSFVLATLAVPALYVRQGSTSVLPKWLAPALMFTAGSTATMATYMALAGLAGADPARLNTAPALLVGLQAQTLARPLYMLVVAGTMLGSAAAAWVLLRSFMHGLFGDLLQLRGSAEQEFLPRALLAVGALLGAQLIATGDSAVARAAIGLSSFGAGTLAVPMLYATRTATRPLVLLIAWLIGAAVWISAVLQQSPGDPALWAAGAAALYATLDRLFSTLRGRRSDTARTRP